MTSIDLLNFPEGEAILKSEDADIDFTAEDLDQEVIAEQKRALLQQIALKNVKTCESKPWWECNARESGNMCYINSERQCVPFGLQDNSKKSYHQSWKEIHYPLYANLQNKLTRARSHSIGRKPTTTTSTTTSVPATKQVTLSQFFSPIAKK